MKKAIFQINIPVSILREEKRFVAYTPVLDISTSGRTYAQTQKRFQELVELFLDELYKKGTLENVLRELGWKKIKAKWQPPILVAHETQTVCVPS